VKLKVWTNSNANCKSKNEEVIDLEHDLGVTEERWVNMTNEEKDKLVLEYCWETEMLSFGYQEDEETK